jgi:ribosomal protein S18 acetylase RimI-like enzyme
MLSTKSIDQVSSSSYKDFSSDVKELDEYLKQFAKGNHKKNIGKTFVLVDEEKVIGFYTISMATIDFHEILEDQRKDLPRYPIPAARIGRLAVDIKYQGKNIGKLLLMDAFERVVEASESIAAYAIVVDAKNEKSKEFYVRFGFSSYEENAMSLYIPIQTVAKIITPPVHLRPVLAP